MSTGTTDSLVRLIQSLSKAEKRSFKLYANRNSSTPDELKFLQLFDFIEKNENYTDELVLQKIKGIKKSQLSNIKAHLYKQLLTSLRLIHANHLPSIEIREAIDHALILYHKGFYNQALKLLEKGKQHAMRIEATTLHLEILEFEKVIESQYITRSMPTRAEELTAESREVEQHVRGAVDFSNLSLQLYALYVKVGFVRDEKDYRFVKEFFATRLPKYHLSDLGFEEKMHLYNAYVWYHYITQEFLMCFKYAKLWVDLFEDNPIVKDQNKEMYLKGLYNFQNALFNLRNHSRLSDSITHLEQIDFGARENENVTLLQELYLLLGKINECYLKGTFDEGLWLVPKVEAFIKQHEDRLDNHRIMILNYKVACLYFGSGDNKSTIKYLNRIIQMKDVSLREDIQCFARILNLIAHFELGNDDLVEYQIKSVYRFLRNMGDLHGVQHEILNFLRQLPFTDEKSLMRGFRVLHAKLVKLSQLPYEKRPFLYLDIISWLECKIERKPVQVVIREKFELEQKTGTRVYFP
ncbi:MAG: hypothetical protein IT221_12680 [Fluviicola sp.]|nr:hypothetical protein [Fluviicola sp.]